QVFPGQVGEPGHGVPGIAHLRPLRPPRSLGDVRLDVVLAVRGEHDRRDLVAYRSGAHAGHGARAQSQGRARSPAAAPSGGAKPPRGVLTRDARRGLSLGTLSILGEHRADPKSAEAKAISWRAMRAMPAAGPARAGMPAGRKKDHLANTIR